MEITEYTGKSFIMGFQFHPEAATKENRRFNRTSDFVLIDIQLFEYILKIMLICHDACDMIRINNVLIT